MPSRKQRRKKKNKKKTPSGGGETPAAAGPETPAAGGPERAAAEKALGTACYKSRDFKGALAHFTAAINADPSDKTLWANRSAVALVSGDVSLARADAERCIKLDASWAKGYARLANAHAKTGDLRAAKRTLASGIAVDPDASFLSDQLAKICLREKGPAGGSGSSAGDAKRTPPPTSSKDAVTSGQGSAAGDTVIGIDLGTTYSCVAVWRNGGVEILPNEEGALTTPSWVAFTEEGRLVGQRAKFQAAKNPKRTLFNIKRIIGREYKDCGADLNRMPFEVKSGSNGKPLVLVDVEGKGQSKKSFMPEQISAMVLERMKAIAEKALKKKVTKAVITVPAYFNDMQRRLTKDAGAIAGLDVLRIINEPTAAALAYGLYTKKQGNVLVFDLGGGTFDVSLLRIEDGIFRVLATAGDTHLGGEDFDIATAEWVAREHTRKVGKSAGSGSLFTTDKNRRKLRAACEKAKRALSDRVSTAVDLYVGGEEISVPLSRKKFEQINEPTFQRCMDSVKKVLKDAKVKRDKVTDVVLVGGSTRIPRVREILSEYFNGKSLCTSVNPDEAVAYGAAVQGAILGGVQNPTCRSVLLVDVIPISLGVGCEGNQFAVVVPRNTSIPCKRTKEFTTVQNYQTSIDIPIYEGERKNCDGNHLLGEFTITNILRAKAGEAKVDVTFELNSNGLLTVRAVDRATGAEADVEIQHDKGRLSPDQIAKLQADAAAFAEADEARASAYEAKMRAEFGDDD